ncbi:transcriptional regulator [Chryseobacterium gotjawalense]|uniref:Transcriptional regulator n=1 Tax=Chryseobacterium gotjawalense TaxID=3042315 RepID=A0ABY8R937_9FLAO|nr:transcriptional regulator [Chryseobacterium sp. wdc7]WHF50471.1 transcriptional regulator [Chryseobacterium sp. wdc7]
MMKPIKSEKQYDEALKRIYALMQEDIVAESKDSDELEFLSILVKEYERENYPVEKPLPLDAIKFRMDQMNITEADLSEILGARSRKSEIFSGKRKLSLSMIRKLKEKLNISADILIQEY